MLNQSRLFSFLDEKSNFTVYFLEGQKLIHDLALLHELKGAGFNYFRNALLTAQPLISFLKPGEGVGLFVDSDNPKFQLKIETNHSGYLRTLLIPEDFNEFPKQISGQCRLAKVLPGQKTPYTSILELNKVSFDEIVNTVLNQSYQIDSQVLVSEESDQSLMVTRLPQLNVNKVEEEVLSKEEYLKKNESFFIEVFKKGLNSDEVIIKEFTDHGYTYLSGRDVQFKCGCSRERMVLGILSTGQNDLEYIFSGNNKDEVEVRCDYCKTYYLITKKEVLKLKN